MPEAIRALVGRIEVIRVEDEAFAAAPGTGVVFHLNATARSMVELLQAGASPDEIAEAISVAGLVSRARVTRDLQALVSELVHNIDRGSEPADGGDRAPRPVLGVATSAKYRLFGHTVCVYLPDANTADTFRQLLAPMAAPPDAPRDLVVTVREVEEKYAVACGAATVTVPRTAWAAFMAMQRVVLCHDKPDPGHFHVVLHAGAVVGRRGAWLVCGASGRGKSTLVARLDTNGLRVLGDDLVPVTTKDRRAFPLAMPFSIKTSGWPVVQAFRGDLLSAHPVTTPIGKQVRYLAPINGPEDEDRDGHPIAGVLLPNRSTEATPTIRSIGLKRAMMGLCDEFGRFPIEPGDLRDLISTIADVPRYELVYRDVEEILPQLSELLGGRSCAP